MKLCMAIVVIMCACVWSEDEYEGGSGDEGRTGGMDGWSKEVASQAFAGEASSRHRTIM